jgi:hypothetical protein
VHQAVPGHCRVGWGCPVYYVRKIACGTFGKVPERSDKKYKSVLRLRGYEGRGERPLGPGIEGGNGQRMELPPAPRHIMLRDLLTQKCSQNISYLIENRLCQLFSKCDLKIHKMWLKLTDFQKIFGYFHIFKRSWNKLKTVLEGYTVKTIFANFFWVNKSLSMICRPCI